MRSKETDKAKAAALQADIMNSPLHCFGSHHNCKLDYCKVVRSLKEYDDNKHNTSSSNSSISTDSSFSSTSSSNSSSNLDSSISSASVTDTSSNSCEILELSTDSDCEETESIDQFLQEQDMAWHDATSPATIDSNATDANTTVAAIDSDAVAAGLDPPHPIDDQMICDIKAIANRLASKAHQLLGMYVNLIVPVCNIIEIVIGNFTTNLAESYMNVRSKFDSGKQVNRSQRGSWQGRCAGAGLRLNLGPDWGPVTWEKATKTTPSATFKAVASSQCNCAAKDRKRKSTEAVKAQRKQAKRLRQDNSQQARLDYSRYDGGQNAAEITTDLSAQQLYDLMKEFYRAKMKVTESQGEAIA